jgi:hypothetical protein
MSSAWPQTRWTSAGGVFNRQHAVTADAPETSFAKPGSFLHTGADLLTEKQRQCHEDRFATDAHVEVEASWCIYPRLIGSYREPDRVQGKKLMQVMIDSLSAGVPTAPTNLKTLGRTPRRRPHDVRAYSNQSGTSNGTTEVINGPLEHLRGSALGFRNSPTTPPDHSSNPAGSDPNYTLNSEEPAEAVVPTSCYSYSWSSSRNKACDPDASFVRPTNSESPSRYTS